MANRDGSCGLPLVGGGGTRPVQPALDSGCFKKRSQEACFKTRSGFHQTESIWRERLVHSGSPAAITAALIACLFVCSGGVFAQSIDKEPVAIIELGGAAGWNLKDGGSSFGPDFAVEVTPIENWLELEAGVTPLFSRHSTEWDTDLLFKKPWTFSKKVEFMFGLGPEWIHARQYGVTTNSAGGEAVLDFMFWPSVKRKLGWYLEPGYEYNFGRGHEKSIGISGGLLIAIP
jgi:hypothetical protein